MLQAELQQLQAQQAQLLLISQSARSLLEQPDSTVPPEEKQRLRSTLDALQAQHQDRLQSCQVPSVLCTIPTFYKQNKQCKFSMEN